MTASADNSRPRSALFHSYVIIIAISFVMIAAGLSRSAFGVFFNPMANELGWSAAEISGTFSFSMIIEGIMSIVSGWLSDKLGTKFVLTFSGILAGAGLVLMSLVHNLWQMYSIYGLAMGIGLGGITVPVISLIARRFKTGRSLMTGVALASNGFGQMLSPLISHRLISAYDWRTSYIILGVLLCLLVAIPAQFLKRPRKESEQAPQVDAASGLLIKPAAHSYTFKEARRTGTFWMMILIFGLIGFCLTSITVHLIPYAIGIGIPAATAANILACYGASMIVGRLVLGTMADKLGNRRMVLIGLVPTIITFVWLIQAKEVWELVLFAMAGGIGLGGIGPSISPLAAKFFGLRAHGSTFGAIGGASVVLGATGPFILGYLFDLTGHYQIPFLICSLSGVVAFITCMLLRPPKDIAVQR